ncbi:thioesterase family protein [Rhodococcus sp. A5(2022)]|uniref:thioesterase family protein n=1 Tax=Rhodococcus sp. A5(2022) TaxID=3003588 RepID=UPI0022A817F0|nr:thioesterase family protein [Rhodococcus sp. A5(2022)]MCZ1073880.1 thioesterase family protein [Rhodococcus sp. A5(2022)]MDV3209423.1 thioesterase family protein [Rhodococcus ruber]
MSDAAYFVPIDGSNPSADVERFQPTAHTVSTWAPTMQHGAPPSALLARALDRHGRRPDARLTRICVELLGPVPLTEIEVRTRIDRPGRKVELVVAELWAAGPDGTARAVARGTAWRMQTTELPEVAHAADAPLPPPARGTVEHPDADFWQTGFVRTLDWRTITPIGAPGPSAAWLRTDVALVEGEAPTPVERLFTVADVANGVGSKLDPAEWTFLNTDLTVHLFREPTGEWIGISAETSTGPDGVGMTAGVLYDEDGAVGRIAQTVQVRPR